MYRVRVHPSRINALVIQRRKRVPAGLQNLAVATRRLATARDELTPLRDDRVKENPPYLTVVLLARVITRIG